MYQFRLTEEIARWAFEVVCKSSDSWYVAFTNPTAGPWKTIKCTDKSGTVGEVFRFELEETRPDILLVNDQMQAIIIVEAKDSLDKLIAGDQASKSADVVVQLSEILSNQSGNRFWGERANYSVYTGLLWGAETPTTADSRNRVFDIYYDLIPETSLVSKELIVGIETCRKAEGLECKMCGKEYKENGASITLAPIANSFGLQIL